MKLLKYLFALLLVTSFIACEDYFGEDSNVDPDNPVTATVDVILPQVQARLVYTWGGDFTRYLGINTHHVDGVGRQFVVYHNYGLLGSDVDQAWSNCYHGIMGSNREMMAAATERGFNHYRAIGLILESYTIMMATDVWGDIPYSDAFKFGENGVYSPTSDTQESIYNQIFANLDEARTLLAGDDGGNPVGGDDLMYGGSPASWTKAANVLTARGKLHLSKRNGASAYSDVAAALNGGFDSSSDDLGLNFGTPASENAPWYQYIEQRDDCETGAAYVATLEAYSDPRLATYGAEHALPHPIFIQNQFVPLLSYTEQEFMKAEALLDVDATAAYNAYLAGISSSFAEAQVGGYDDYIAQGNVGVGADNLTLENIMTQKYIALYTSPEVFNDWRRTGLPSLDPNTGTEIPRRFPYPDSESLSNSNAPAPGTFTIFSPVWWDN